MDATLGDIAALYRYGRVYDTLQSLHVSGSLSQLGFAGKTNICN